MLTVEKHRGFTENHRERFSTNARQDLANSAFASAASEKAVQITKKKIGNSCPKRGTVYVIFRNFAARRQA
jgi:hypothetical protein